MKPSFFSILFLVAVVAVRHFSTAEAQIEGVCKAAVSGNPIGNIDYYFCVTSLQAVPGSRDADAQGLAVIAAELSVANATFTNLKISAMINSSAGRVKEGLESCSAIYDSMLLGLREVVDAVKLNRYEEAKAALGTAMEGPESCEGKFMNAGIESPVAKEDMDLLELMAITMAFARNLG